MAMARLIKPVESRQLNLTKLIAFLLFRFHFVCFFLLTTAITSITFSCYCYYIFLRFPLLFRLLLLLLHLLLLFPLLFRLLLLPLHHLHLFHLLSPCVSNVSSIFIFIFSPIFRLTSFSDGFSLRAILLVRRKLVSTGVHNRIKLNIRIVRDDSRTGEQIP